MGAQPPYGPTELLAPPLSGEAFLAQLERQWQEKCPQPSPFFQAMYDGKLKSEDIQTWVKDWYIYWDDGVVYSTASLFVKNNDEPMRTHILRRIVDIEGENLVEEHSGSQTPAWEELWLRFGEGIGVPRRETENAKPYSRTYFAVQTLRSYSRYWDWSWLDGIATLYASDLYGQEFLGRAYDALKNQYHVPDHALEFFRIYLGDIESHFGWEKEALTYWCCTTERQLTAARAFRERIDIDQQMLVGLEQSCLQDEPFFQVP